MLYIGFIAPYEERTRKALLVIAIVLKLANVDFGILGPQETDGGAEVYDLGELLS